MDAAHVALLDVSFPKRSFESLKADASMFGIKIEDFKRCHGHLSMHRDSS